MAFIAKAVLLEDSVDITFYSDTDWVGLEWTSKIESLGFPHYDLMFDFTNAGTGVLIDSRTLKINIRPTPPGVFSVTTSQGKKDFELIDGKMQFPPVWTKVDDFTLRSYTINSYTYYNKPALVYISNTYGQFFKPLQYGILKDGEEAVGIFRGTGFGGIRRDTYLQPVWPYGGVVFHDIIWYKQPPSSPQMYTLNASLNGVKGNVKVEKEVILNDNQILSPINSFYNLNNPWFATMRLDDGSGIL